MVFLRFFDGLHVNLLLHVRRGAAGEHMEVARPAIAKNEGMGAQGRGRTRFWNVGMRLGGWKMGRSCFIVNVFHFHVDGRFFGRGMIVRAGKPIFLVFMERFGRRSFVLRDRGREIGVIVDLIFVVLSLNDFYFIFPAASSRSCFFFIFERKKNRQKKIKNAKKKWE